MTVLERQNSNKLHYTFHENAGKTWEWPKKLHANMYLLISLFKSYRETAMTIRMSVKPWHHEIRSITRARYLHHALVHITHISCNKCSPRTPVTINSLKHSITKITYLIHTKTNYPCAWPLEKNPIELSLCFFSSLFKLTCVLFLKTQNFQL